MQENGDVTDDSDETIVESSAFENDSDEDELHLKRLLFVCKEASFTSLTNSVCRASGRQSVLGHPSPEIQLMCRLSEKQDKMDQMDQISYDNKEYSEKSLSSSAASNMITSTAKVKEKSITTLEEMTSQNLFNEDDQNPEMIRSETTISLKDQSLGSRKLETGTSSEPSGMIPMRTSVGQALLHRNDGEINITDLLRPLDVSESPGVSSPLTDLFTPQSDVLSMYSSPNKKSCTLPSELVTALNALPRCALEPVSQMKMNALLENTAEQRTECLKSKANLFQIDEECTQIAEMALDPWFAEQQNEQLQELTESQLQDTLDEQLLNGQLNIERLTFSNSISSGENQAKAGRSSPSKETREHSFITRKSARKRNQSKCSCCEMDSFKYGSVFSIQPEAKRRITQRNSRANDMSSDKDVKEKHAVAKPDKNKLTLSKKAFHSEDTCHKKGLQPKRCSAETGNETCQSLSLGIINRRNIFGETQLHKAAMEGDANHACTLIKAGANINVQDYAGWTALHEASAAGFYKIVKVLLEAGADVNCRGSGQITPIHDAAKEGYYEVHNLFYIRVKV
uniref:Ankyrin repeat domain-containing protein 31 n=1 Tax=Geotrypetes seraphini TaxID=260995 RepID=A0A6P8S6D3_GEOSA|nr:ankyrin repeat domain-containing protein 31 [Geotrypetes seraphini]